MSRPPDLSLYIAAMVHVEYSCIVAAFSKSASKESAQRWNPQPLMLDYVLSPLDAQAKPAMWAAILQPEDNETDLEKFTDAPDADEDALRASAPVDEAEAAASTLAAQPRGSTGSGSTEEHWPAEGAYDMTKRCVYVDADGLGAVGT